MVEVKIKIEEKDNKDCADIVATIVKVGIEIEGKSATKTEREVAKEYEDLLNRENKVHFINKSKQNKKQIDALINEIKHELGI